MEPSRRSKETHLYHKRRKKLESTVQTLKKDKEFVKSFIRENDLMFPSQIKSELCKLGYQTNQKEIENELYKIQAEKYPRESFIAFSPQNCKSSDSEHNIFRGYFKWPAVSEKQAFSEIVVLTSQFQLARLSEHSEWYLDGTFWCALKGFYQL